MNIEDLFQEITAEDNFTDSETEGTVSLDESNETTDSKNSETEGTVSLDESNETTDSKSSKTEQKSFTTVTLQNGIQNYIEENSDKKNLKILETSTLKIDSETMVLIYYLSDNKNDIVVLRNTIKTRILDIPISLIKVYQSGIEIHQESGTMRFVTFVNRLGSGKPESFMLLDDIPVSSTKITEDTKFESLLVEPTQDKISKEEIVVLYPPYKKINKDKDIVDVSEAISDLMDIAESVKDINHLVKIYRVLLRILSRRKEN